MERDTEFYVDMRRTATELFYSKGQTLVLTHYGEPVSNDDDGTVSISETVAVVAGVLVDYTREDSGETADAAPLVQIGDRKIMCSAETIANGEVSGVVPFELRSTDTVTLENGDVWVIVNARPKNAAGLVVSFELQVKRG